MEPERRPVTQHQPTVNLACMDAPEHEQLEELAGRLDAVELAMARLDTGSYGTCTMCGAELEADLLERDPLIDRCAACTTKS